MGFLFPIMKKELLELIKYLSDKQRGILFTALLHYKNDMSYVIKDLTVDSCYRIIISEPVVLILMSIFCPSMVFSKKLLRGACRRLFSLFVSAVEIKDATNKIKIKIEMIRIFEFFINCPRN